MGKITWPVTRTWSWCWVLGFLAGSVLCRSAGWAAAQEATELLPGTTVFYVQCRAPGELVKQLLNHPLYNRLQQHSDFQAQLAPLQPVNFVIQLIELQMGMTRDQILQAVAGRGMVLAVDGQTQGAALLARATDQTVPAKLRDVVVGLIREDARRNGRSDPVRSREYRGVSVHRVDNAWFAVWDEWLLITNHADLGKGILDRFFDRSKDSLAAKESFQQAMGLCKDDATLWGYADLTAIRASLPAGKFLPDHSRDAGAELLLGGVLAVLDHASFAVAALSLDHERLSVSLTSPARSEWISAVRQYYFGPQLSGRAPPVLVPPGTIASLSTYRDLGQFWLRAGELFDKETADQFAEADSTLTTLFSGHDFGGDILGAVDAGLQLVVARQEFAQGQPIPAIRLPAVALIAELKNPDTMRRELRRIFQSFVGFLNIVSAMNGQPQLELDEEREGDVHLVLARFVPPADGNPQQSAAIQFNFVPCLAFAGTRVVLATSPTLARQVLAPDCPVRRVEPGTNTALYLDAPGIRSALLDNRQHLVAQAILNEGRSREEAEKQVDALFFLLQQVQSLDARLGVGEQLHLEAQLHFKADQP
jgi:hypothetical protein